MNIYIYQSVAGSSQGADGFGYCHLAADRQGGKAMREGRGGKAREGGMEGRREGRKEGRRDGRDGRDSGSVASPPAPVRTPAVRWIGNPTHTSAVRHDNTGILRADATNQGLESCNARNARNGPETNYMGGATKMVREAIIGSSEIQDAQFSP